jgi:hypothetical protein
MPGGDDQCEFSYVNIRSRSDVVSRIGIAIHARARGNIRFIVRSPARIFGVIQAPPTSRSRNSAMPRKLQEMCGSGWLARDSDRPRAEVANAGLKPLPLERHAIGHYFPE